ncbi:adventurous gliding motility protein AgmX [Schaalia meyeri]|uniref:Adventurous gliding motility protein AgmX n=1 Tax=Schaalia meyeri TaxID=52773 RepID=A0AAP9Y8R6_9ACTO|nr:hypothetical protein [Schaalia meyeri]OFQ24329.1 hypothetical protein HMPREF2946_06160 [Actinomyces sp. HMSC062G12]QQC44539.1 adventurous gliding motility protein AgmX [Schaalia meyeri]SDR64614.1 hypothetical protein SAMN04489715_0254 [Schaalia meyeri]
MSNPLDPNQQPISGAGHGVAGPYPGGQQFGAPYDPRSAQQTPATGGFSGYGQNQPGWAPQPQQGYYGVQGPALQGVAYPNGSYGSFGGQPQQSGPKKGLIIGIIGAVMAFILLIVLALALTQNGNRSSDRSASPTAPGGATPVPSATQPNPGSAQNPSSAPDNKSQNSSNEVSSEEERNVKEVCRDALMQSVSKGSIDDWKVDRDGANEAGEPQFLMTGKFNGTLSSGRSGVFNFKCTAVHHPQEKSYEAWASLDTK